MLENIKKEDVNIIVTKSVSRLGRYKVDSLDSETLYLSEFNHIQIIITVDFKKIQEEKLKKGNIEIIESRYKRGKI